MKEQRNASNQLTFEFGSIESNLYLKVTKSIVAHFMLTAENKLTSGLSEYFQNYKTNDSSISLEWDNWTGYSVTANNMKSEPLVRNVAIYINEKYN